MTGQIGREREDGRRCVFRALQQVCIVPVEPEDRGLPGEIGQRLALSGRVRVFGGELDRALEAQARLVRVATRGGGDPSPGRQPSRSQRRRIVRGDRRGATCSTSRLAIAEPPAARNASAVSPISLAARNASSPRDTARSGITFARAKTWTP
jgi:hypothetical protein